MSTLSQMMQMMTLGSGATDPYWSNVVALLHMNGTNGGTSFPDQKSHTFTPHGSVQTSTAVYKWSGSSALFNGSTDWLSAPTSSDWDFGSGDFTVEAWVRSDTTAPTFGAIVTSRASGGVYGPFMICKIGQDIGFLASVSGGGWELNANSSGVQFPYLTWTHVAMCRASGVFYLWVNGVAVGAPVTGISGALYNPLQPLTIGAYTDGGTPYGGNMQDIRLTKGVARYTTAFTPPTAPFPNS